MRDDPKITSLGADHLRAIRGRAAHMLSSLEHLERYPCESNEATFRDEAGLLRKAIEEMEAERYNLTRPPRPRKQRSKA